MDDTRDFTGLIDAFNAFLKDERGRVEALEVIYSAPYGSRALTPGHVRGLVTALGSEPYALTIDKLWGAYREHDNARVRGSAPGKQAMNVISLVAYAKGDIDLLEPYRDRVGKRFSKWVYECSERGVTFPAEQMGWLAAMRDEMAGSLHIGISSLDGPAFEGLGGAEGARKVFGSTLDAILAELASELSP